MSNNKNKEDKLRAKATAELLHHGEPLESATRQIQALRDHLERLL